MNSGLVSQHPSCIFFQDLKQITSTIKELKLIAELLENQEEVFKERLHDAVSLDVVDEIEVEIQNKNQLLDGALERLIPSPNDELVAGQIINFLKENKHLFSILQAFDLYGSLTNDILNARASIIAKKEFPDVVQPMLI